VPQQSCQQSCRLTCRLVSNMRVQYSLRLSREECIVASGDANVWIDGKLPKPLFVSITKGTPTCDMLSGKHLKTTGSGA
jgi:hypothetical protein